MSPSLPALLMRQSDEPGLAFSSCTHLAVMPWTAPAPAGALGSLTCTWPNSDWCLPAPDDDAPRGLASPQATPAPTETKVATTTRTTLFRCTGREAYRRHPAGQRHRKRMSDTFAVVERRTFLKAVGGLGLLALAPATRVRALLDAAP